MADSLRYLSLFSGIEAATVAWKPLGWAAIAFAEIEPFPCAVLSHHYPEIPNWGDVTNYKEWPNANVDICIGGSPCQSFSVAGLRKGLDDPRGNLALTYLAIADRYRPQWVVWENVPGVLSSNGGRDFGSFLGGLGQLGYGFAYRVLDAQNFGVPQRRRRVFVVGHLGDWRAAAAVLFERHSLSEHPAPRREAGASVAALTAAGVGTCDADDNQGQAGHLIPQAFGGNDTTGPIEVSAALNAHGGPCVGMDFESETFAVFTNRGRTTDGVAETLRAGCHGALPMVAQGVTLHGSSRTASTATYASNCSALRARAPGNVENSTTTVVHHGMGVRRLTSTECARLQGFPDDYLSQVVYRGKPPKDDPMYKALGNSMAVPVMRWIGERIAAVEAIKDDYLGGSACVSGGGRV